MRKPFLATSSIFESTRLKGRLSGGTVPVDPKSLPRDVLLEIIRDLADTAVEACGTERSSADRKEQTELIEFFEEVASVARCVLLKRGRPPKDYIDRAEKMLAEGKSMKEIYRELGLKTPAEKRALDSALRQRKNRRKTREQNRQIS
jgi:hypothetical protein